MISMIEGTQLPSFGPLQPGSTGQATDRGLMAAMPPYLADDRLVSISSHHSIAFAEQDPLA